MFKKISKNTVASQVINQVTDLIRCGRLHPGDRLPSERDLAEKLGVSRPPLREALRVLEYAGIIESRYGDGIYVRSAEFPLETSPWFSKLIDSYTLRDLVEMRKIIETASVNLAVKRATDEDIETVRGIHKHSLACIDDMEAFVEADFAFHRAIAETTRNTMLFNTVNTMRKLMSDFNMELLRNKRYRLTVRRHHGAILSRLADRDAPKAIDAMERHLDNVVDMSKHVLTVDDGLEAEKETPTQPPRNLRQK